jgi:hypothetical protein
MIALWALSLSRGHESDSSQIVALGPRTAPEVFKRADQVAHIPPRPHNFFWVWNTTDSSKWRLGVPTSDLRLAHLPARQRALPNITTHV